jgi:hypothetical protein
MTQGDIDHPDLQGVAGEMRAEWRAEQESATDDAAAQWRHTRKLADWLTERANAGDRIAVTIYNQRFAGLVEEIGDDLIGLRCAFGRVDVHLIPSIPIFFEINDKALQGGDRPRTGRVFHDALRERDAHPDTSVGTVHDPEGLDGTLFVGEDFVSVVARLGAETVVPVTSVVWASARRD